MEEDAFVGLLDQTDTYICANEVLIAAIRKAFFASAQAHYATGYRKAPVVVDTISSLRVEADKSSEALEVHYRIQNTQQAPSSKLQGVHADFIRQRPSHSGQESEQSQPNQKDNKETDDTSPSHKPLPSATYSSLISEIAEKFGCSDEQEQYLADADDVLEFSGENSRKFLPPQWQTVRASFRTALDAALRTAEARTSLQLQLDKLRAGEALK